MPLEPCEARASGQALPGSDIQLCDPLHLLPEGGVLLLGRRQLLGGLRHRRGARVGWRVGWGGVGRSAGGTLQGVAASACSPSRCLPPFWTRRTQQNAQAAPTNALLPGNRCRSDAAPQLGLSVRHRPSRLAAARPLPTQARPSPPSRRRPSWLRPVPSKAPPRLRPALPKARTSARSSVDLGCARGTPRRSSSTAAAARSVLPTAACSRCSSERAALVSFAPGWGRGGSGGRDRVLAGAIPFRPSPPPPAAAAKAEGAPESAGGPVARSPRQWRLAAAGAQAARRAAGSAACNQLRTSPCSHSACRLLLLPHAALPPPTQQRLT
jgi:hypothetical protein